MNEDVSPTGPGAQVILHPTDLSEASQVAFAHALRLATHNKAFLSLLHVCADDTKPVPWEDYPSVRETLARWGLLESGARRSDVARQLGLRVEKVVGYESNVTDAIVGFLRERAVDMIVIATEGRTGLPRWIKPSIAEPVAQRANVPTLFVPHGARNCVSLDDGHVTLDNVLIPVAWKPQPDSAIARGFARWTHSAARGRRSPCCTWARAAARHGPVCRTNAAGNARASPAGDSPSRRSCGRRMSWPAT
jgi:nucleotide-binding universal stress UspA family protein